MRRLRTPWRQLLPIVLIGVAWMFGSMIGGCAGSGPAPLDLNWPPPPQEPMIRFVRSVESSAGLERGFTARLKDFLFGKSPDMAIGKPYGLAWDTRSRLYLADTAKKGVLILDFASGSVRLVTSLGARGRLIEPVNLILDRQSRLYVADTGLHKIAVFDPEGEFTHFIGEDELTSPVGLAWSADRSRLYVTDAAQHEVKVFTPDGELIAQFGERGDEQGQFYHPLGIAISATDTVYVVDSFHFAVQAFDLAGNYLFSFGSTATGMGTLARPRSIAIDSDGHLYITDALKHNVHVHDELGNRILGFGSQGFGPGQFRLPAGIFVTEDDRILVADSVNKRIQEFQYLAAGPGREES
jgi:DNA-binding beta-propeller fold protein YncE